MNINSNVTLPNVPALDPITVVVKIKTPVPVLKLYEKGYVYGQREVGVIVSGSKKFADKINELLLSLNKAIKEKDLTDNKRSSSKTSALLGQGGFWAWWQNVNDLNIQKKHVSTIVDQVVDLIIKSDKKLDIVSTDHEGKKVSIKDELLLEMNKATLGNFFTEGRFQYTFKA